MSPEEEKQLREKKIEEFFERLVRTFIVGVVYSTVAEQASPEMILGALLRRESATQQFNAEVNKELADFGLSPLEDFDMAIVAASLDKFAMVLANKAKRDRERQGV